MVVCYPDIRSVKRQRVRGIAYRETFDCNRRFDLLSCGPKSERGAETQQKSEDARRMMLANGVVFIRLGFLVIEYCYNNQYGKERLKFRKSPGYRDVVGRD